MSNEERTAHGAIIVRNPEDVAALADGCEFEFEFEFEFTACADSYDAPRGYGGWISVSADHAQWCVCNADLGKVRAWPRKAPSVSNEYAREQDRAKNEERRRLMQNVANVPRGDIGHAEAEPRWDREEPIPLSDNQKIIRLLERILRALERK